jgi:hypothetical protein
MFRRNALTPYSELKRQSSEQQTRSSDPEDAGSTFLQNFSKLLPSYIAWLHTSEVSTPYSYCNENLKSNVYYVNFCALLVQYLRTFELWL